MNNTRTTTLAVAAIFIAATLVVGIGTFAAAATTHSAFAYPQKKGDKDNGKGNGNGNTVTIEECKNRGFASGFDTAVNQECENLICTHPGENATCTEEGGASIITTTANPTAATLTVKKVVVGGGKAASDFQIQVTGNNPKPDMFLGSNIGTVVTLEPGPFKVTETPLFDNSVTNYQPDFSKDCSGGGGTIQANEHLTCTITNLPIGPPEK